MSNIVAIEKDGIVYVGTDTVKEIDSMNLTHRSPENIRIKALSCGVIVGCLGNAASTQQIFAHEEWFDTEILDKKYIVTEIVPRIYDAIMETEEWESERFAHEKRCSVVTLIAKGGDIYTILNDMVVNKCKGYTSLSYNSGDEMVMAYMSASTEKDPLKLIKEVFKIGEKYNDGMFSDIAMINTKDMKLEIVESEQ